MIEVIEAKYLTDYKLWLKFNNGVVGEVDLKNDIWGPAFEPLKEISFFKQIEVSKVMGTVVWPNEVDFAPEFLLDKIII